MEDFMRRTKILVLFTATFMVVCGILCNIFYVASQAEVHLTCECEIPADNRGTVWVHAGDHFLWTITEE